MVIVSFCNGDEPMSGLVFGTLAAAHNPGMFLLAFPEMLSGGKAYEKINEYSIQRL